MTVYITRKQSEEASAGLVVIRKVQLNRSSWAEEMKQRRETALVSDEEWNGTEWVPTQPALPEPNHQRSEESPHDEHRP